MKPERLLRAILPDVLIDKMCIRDRDGEKRQYCNAAICRGACGDWYCFITDDY